MNYKKLLLAFISVVLITLSIITINNSLKKGKILGVADVVGSPYLIWDGELPYLTISGNTTSTNCFGGTSCFEGLQDPWHIPAIKLDGLTSYKGNISDYHELRFYAKSELTNKVIYLNVNEYYGKKGNSIDIAPYIEGGVLDNTWRLVAVPTALIDNGSLNEIYSFSFGKSTVNNKIYIDSLNAVKVATPLRPEIASISPIEISGNINSANSGSFSITNNGNTSLIINSFAFSGANSSEFSTTNSIMTIAPGQSQTATFTFTPTSAGNKSAILTINHNKTINGYSTNIAITGIGTEPGLNPTPSSLDFGSTPVGQSLIKSIALNNTSNQSITVSSINNSNPAFTVTPSTITIAGNSSQNINITFAPTSASNYTNTLTINSNSVSRPQITASIMGIGVVSGEIGGLSLKSSSLSSSKVTLSWSPYAGADKTRIYVGSEPPATPSGDLPIKKLITTLSGTATNYNLTNLAAQTDVFIRVEALTGESLLASDNIYIRTTGGPKASLDTGAPLREAHLVSPDTIELVIADNYVNSYTDAANPYKYDLISGYDGREWQAGPWTVSRGNGNAVSVTNVYRHSVSAGQPYYSVGWPIGISENNRVDVDHHIYLKLNQAIGNREVLSITGPLNFSTILPFSDKYLETPTIQVNQVGYSPQASRRYAYVSNWLGDGGTLSLSSFPSTAEMLVDYSDTMTPRVAAISNLSITSRSTNDPNAVGEEVKEINLASVPPAEGVVYRVRIPGVGVSWPTQISNSAIFKAFYTNLRGVYFNRWGRDLQPQWAGEWSTRSPDHTMVYTSDYPSNNRADIRIPTQPLVNSRPMTGGHHDAGDFDQQVDHFKHSLILMDIYELNPNIFTDNQMTIPESGNGVPDLLDEALYNLKGWEQLQDYGETIDGITITNYEPLAIRLNDGAIRGGVESYRHPAGYFFADTDQDPYWTYAKDPKWSLAFAGNFAKASRLVAPFDINKAKELKYRAIAAYNYSLNQGINESISGLMFYASGELFRLTGEQKYLDKFNATWTANNPYGKGIILYDRIAGGWANNSAAYPNMSPLFSGYLGATNINATYASQLNTSISAAANFFTNMVDNGSVYRRSMPTSTNLAANSWGYGTAGGIHLISVFDRLKNSSVSASDRQKYINAISLSADYLLGTNPQGMTWVTGLGSRKVEEPVHTDSLAFMKQGKEPIPGLHVFGPTGSIYGVGYYNPAKYVFYPEFMNQPVLRRWGESRNWPAITETPMDLTILDVLLFAALLPTDEVLTPPTQMKPLGSDYTNPLAPRYAVSANVSIDYVAPITTASLVAGTYIGAQKVSLFANEAVSIYYCLGTNCSPTTLYTGAITISATQPLRYYSRDTSGNTETIKSTNYTITDPCTENWSCSAWSTCSGTSQTRTCTDSNSCGTIINKPTLSQGCTVTCSPNWTCSAWTTCTGGSQSRTCSDAKGCGIISGKPVVISACSSESSAAGGANNPLSTTTISTSTIKIKVATGTAIKSTEIKPNAIDGYIAKVKNGSAVYYILNSFRYLFVNRFTYTTWSKEVGDIINNFSNLKIISQADFENTASGSNIPAKAGSLIKFDNDPKSYGVGSDAKLYEIADLATQKALYGSWTPYIIQAGFRDNYYNHGNIVGILTATSTKPQ